MVKTRQMKTIIVEDHPLLQEAIKNLFLNNFPESEIECFSSPKRALMHIQNRKADVMTVDLEYSDGSCGINFVSEVRKFNDTTRIVAYTSHKVFQILNSLKKAGFNSYVCKESIDRELIDTIEYVLKKSVNSFYESPSFKNNIDEHILIEEKFFSSEYEKLKTLTKTEVKAIDIITNNREISNEDLAENLGIKTTTVKKHITNIYNKIRVSSKEGIALFFNHIKEKKLK